MFKSVRDVRALESKFTILRRDIIGKPLTGSRDHDTAIHRPRCCIAIILRHLIYKRSILSNFTQHVHSVHFVPGCTGVCKDGLRQVLITVTIPRGRFDPDNF